MAPSRSSPTNIAPDLLTFNSGAAVTRDIWAQRRKELHDAIIPHEYGGMPPDPQRVELVRRARSTRQRWPVGSYTTYEVRACFAGGKDLSLTLKLWRPIGDGPFPVLLDGDGCWRCFNDEVVRQVVMRGNIAASVDRTEAAADNKDEYHHTGLYRLFPDAAFGVVSAWAWAIHRCVDALVQMQDVRADGIAVTGHSRGGKMALLAGATDERIAVTNPNGSGIGGSGLNRLKAAGSEVVDSFYRSGNIFWFGQGFKDHRHRDAELPYDQHFLHAMVAPRLLLATEGYEDAGANPPGSYAACQAARSVYDLLGKPANIGWAIREGGHAHTLTDYEALLDFMDAHLHRRDVCRNFQRPLFADLNELLCEPGASSHKM
jgi:hypothetical protein